MFKFDEMISVEDAEKIILSLVKDFGTEYISLEDSFQRVLAEDLVADRDIPPYNRATLDGVAISYASFQSGIRNFHIDKTQAAGDIPVDISDAGGCIEIMTGAALPSATDTVIAYEELDIHNGSASIRPAVIKKGQGVHCKGKDKKKNEIVANSRQLITPVIISIAASVGKKELLVKKLPKVVVISSGDELVDVDEVPSPYQVRRSNNYMISAALLRHNVYADTLHIPDDRVATTETFAACLQDYDVIIVSGGVSMGKFDYIPQALHELSVKKLFHKVKQRPGKPFWFGNHANGALVFALPGNPVSAFMCLYRYVLPWLKESMGLLRDEYSYAILAEDISFIPSLQYFLQVKLIVGKDGNILAMPVAGNGSGDFVSLSNCNAFMELPQEQNNFTKGEVFRVWPFAKVFF